MSIAIIPARGGSKRIPRKNIKTFLGIPIVAYPIKAAKESQLFDRIVVSTEDSEIAKIAIQYGAEVLNRPRHLAELDGHPDPGTQAVTRSALDTLGWKGEFACCIYPTAALLEIADLLCANSILKRGKTPFVFAEGIFYFGKSENFGITDHKLGISMSSFRFIDINTLDDWTKAESIYRELYAKKGYSW